MNARPASVEDRAFFGLLTKGGKVVLPLMLSCLFGVSGWLISEALASREIRQNTFTKLEAAEMRRAIDNQMDSKTMEIKEAQSQIRSDLEVIKAILLRIENGM